MPNILIVDDEETLRSMLEIVFARAGWTPTSVETAEEGWDAIQTGTPAFDLVLTDKNLPGMSGVDLVEKVRRAKNDVPIVMMTAFASAESVVVTMNLGIDAYLEKPFDDLHAVPVLADGILRRRQEDASRPSRVREAGDTLLSIAVLASGPEAEARLLAPIDRERAQPTIASNEDRLVTTLRTVRLDLVIVDADPLSDVLAIVRQIRDLAPATEVAILASGNLPVAVLRGFVDAGVKSLLDGANYSHGIRDLVERLWLKKSVLDRWPKT